MKYIITILICFLFSVSEIFAQRFSVSTNVIDWLSLGTVNAEGSVSVGRRVTLHTGFMLNPWTFRGYDSDKQYQSRQQTYFGGVRLWPWNIYSGWWFGSNVQYSEYNRGGFFSRTTEEGDSYGIGVNAGYTLMVHKHFNIDFGIGVWGGSKRYTVYSCPRCGEIRDKGRKFFILPDKIQLAISYIF